MAFVAAHDGNDTEAARAAGYKNPARSAAKLMAIPAVRKAIEEKQKATIKASGAKIGRRLTKVDVVDRLVELADLPPDRTKGNITGQVNALKAIAEIEGFIGRQTMDITKEAEGKTEAEMQFFCAHGYWPASAGDELPPGMEFTVAGIKTIVITQWEDEDQKNATSAACAVGAAGSVRDCSGPDSVLLWNGSEIPR